MAGRRVNLVLACRRELIAWEDSVTSCCRLDVLSADRRPPVSAVWRFQAVRTETPKGLHFGRLLHLRYWCTTRVPPGCVKRPAAILVSYTHTHTDARASVLYICVYIYIYMLT